MVLAVALTPFAASAQDMTPDSIDIVEVALGSGQFEALLAANLAETVATT